MLEAPAKVGAALSGLGAGDCGEGRPAVLGEDSAPADLRPIYAIENTRSEPGESTARADSPCSAPGLGRPLGDGSNTRLAPTYSYREETHSLVGELA